MLAFPLNTGELDYLVPIVLPNEIPFTRFGNAAFSGKFFSGTSINKKYEQTSQTFAGDGL